MTIAFNFGGGQWRRGFELIKQDTVKQWAVAGRPRLGEVAQIGLNTTPVSLLESEAG